MRDLAIVGMFLISNLLSAAYASPDPCPQLKGTFWCRSDQPFDLNVGQELQEDITVYKLTDPTGERTVLTDGKPHEMDFRSGKGEYSAHCENEALVMEARSPEGEIVRDRYYIQRAALVRIRLNKTKKVASSISCAPTHGTWKLYPH